MRLALVTMIGLLALCSAASARAQIHIDGPPPPVKMGLWEQKMTIGDGGPSNGLGHAFHVCFTAASYADAMSKLSAMGGKENCTETKNEHGVHEWVMDMSCKPPRGGSIEAHTVTEMIDAEHMHTTGNSTMVINGKTMSFKSTADFRYLASDCGSVAPGKPEIVH